MRRKAEGVREASAIFNSKLGWAGAAVSEKGICRIVLPKKSKREVAAELNPPHSPFSKGGNVGFPPLVKGGKGGFEKAALNVVKLLQRYFSGKCVSLDLPLDLRYYTAFQQAVWRAACTIPCGETRSYAWIANKIRNPKAVRAVGQALGANPIPIIIPCHRVISSSGGLGGYSGGLGMKGKLLELEAKAHDRC